jgi:actin-related protein
MSSTEAPSGSEGSSLLLLSQPVVIDNGTATIKAGFAGTSKPKVR